MRIICPKCATEYFLDSAKLAVSGTAVQCSACEHSFTVVGEGPGEAAKTALPPEPAFTSPAAAAPAPAPVAPAPAPVAPAPVAPAPVPVAPAPVPVAPAPVPVAPAPVPVAPAPVAPAPVAAAPVAPAPVAAAPVAAAPVAPATAQQEGSPSVRKQDGRLFLSQGERVYKIKDLPTLQRWIVEKRVLPSDRISEDGTNWDVVSQRADLRPFFAVIEQIKSAKRQLRQRDREVREVAQRAVQALASSTSDDQVSSFASMSVRELASGALDEEFSPAAIPEAKSSGVIRDATSAMAALGSFGSAAESAPIDAPRHSASPRDLSEAGAGESPADQGQAFSAAMSAPSWGGSGPVTGSSPVTETRAIPVVPDPAVRVAESGDTDGSFEEGAEGGSESAFWSESGWDGDSEASAQAASSGELASGGEDHGDVDDEAFDPDQTFDEYKAGSSAVFYLGVIAFVAFSALGLWYVLLGPGSPGASPGGGSATLDPSATTSTEALSKLQITPPQADVSNEGSAVVSPAEPHEGSAETSAGQEAQAEKSRASQPVQAEPKPAQLKQQTQQSAQPKQQAQPKQRTQPKQQAPPKQQARPKQRQPEKKVDHFAAGEAYFDNGSFTQAITSYKKALKADPNDFKSAKQLGWAYIEGGQASSARSAFSKAVSLRRSSSEAHYGLGMAFEELGSSSKALSEYEAALKLAPNGPDAPELRALISKMK